LRSDGFSSILMKKSKEGIKEMRFDKLDPVVGGAQINVNILRTRSWSRCFDRLGRYKTCESGTSDLSGEYGRSSLGLVGSSRGLPESRCLRVGLSLSGILRLEDEWRLGVRWRFRDDLWLGFGLRFAARGIGGRGLLGGFWLDQCGFFRLDGLGVGGRRIVG
jgi:hypothetical protein